MIITHENGIDTISNVETLKNKKPTYKVFLLDDGDFDNLHKDLPYMKKEKLKNSFGFANPKTNEAYIRKTGVKEIDDSTIEHELQELLVKISPDEEDGIRYKSGGSLGRILGPIVGAVLTPVLGPGGPLIGAAISGGTRLHSQSKKPEKFGKPTFGSIAGRALEGGAGSFLGGKAITGGLAGVNAAGAAGKGFVGKVGGAVKGAASGLFGTGGAAKGPLQGPVTEAQSKAGFNFLGEVPASFGSGAAVASQALQGPVTAAQAAKGFSSLAQVPGGAGAVGVGAGAGTGGIAKTITSKIGEFASKPANLLGGSLLAGSILPKSPEFEFPSQFTDLQSKLSQGGALSPLGQQARTELSSILGATPGELHPEANQQFLDATFRQLDQSFQRDKEALDARYNQAGVLGSGEHLAAVDELERSYTNIRNDTTAQINQRNFELGRTEKYQAIQTSLGVDKSDMDNLLGLTGISVEMAARIYQVEAADVETLRESMGTLGSELLIQGGSLPEKKTTFNIGGGGLLGGL